MIRNLAWIILALLMAQKATAALVNPPSGARPYLLLTSNRLAHVQAKKNVSDLGWQKFIAQLNGHQGTGSYAPYGWLAADALAYKVTGDAKYLADAQSKYNEYYASWNYQDGSGLTYQWTCRYLCWAFDWLYNDLPANVRDAWRQKIKDAALFWQPKCYPKNYNDGLSYRDTDHTEFLMENMLYAGMCLWGSDTNAEALVATSDDILNNVIVPKLLSNWYNGGYIWSGTMYGTEEGKHVLRPMIVNAQTRGIPYPTQFFDSLLRSELHQTFPGYEGLVEYGDIHLGNYQPAGWSSEAYPPYGAFELVPLTQWMSTNALLRSHAQYWLNRYEAMLDRDLLLNVEPWAIESLLYQDFHNAPATNPATLGVGLVEFAPSGFVAMRNSWEDNATALYFHNSEWNCDHQHLDCGHYTIVRNKRPVTSDLAGYWGGGYPACQDTLAHNAILIENPGENHGQSGVGLDLQAGVTATAVDYDDLFGYVQGEYGPAYNYIGWNGVDMSGNYVVSNALRKILWLKPDVFILHDFISLYPNKAPRWKKLIHHFQGTPTMSNGVVTCFSDGNNKMFFKPLLPAGAPLTLVKEDTIFLNYAQDGIMDGQKFWYAEIAAGNTRNPEQFLNVLYLADSNSAAVMPAVNVLTNNSNTFTGAQLALGDTNYVWMCKQGVGRAGQLDYSPNASTNPMQHIVTDLNTAFYFVMATPNGIKLDVMIRATNFAGAVQIQASAQGTLKFLTAPNGAVIQQNPPDTPPVTITALASPPNGGVISGGGFYATGSVAQISAAAHLGWRFAGWSDGVTNNARTYSVVSNATLTANFTNAPMSVLLQAGAGGMAGLWTLGTNYLPATWATVTGPLGGGWVLRALNQNRILLQAGNGGMIGLWDLNTNGVPTNWWTVSGALPGWIARDLDGNRILLQAGDGGMIGLWTLTTNNTPAAWSALAGPMPNLIARGLCDSRVLLQFSSGNPCGYWTLNASNAITAWTPIAAAVPSGWILRSMTPNYMLLQAGDGGLAGMWDLDANGQPTAWHAITGPLPGWILRGIDQP